MNLSLSPSQLPQVLEDLALAGLVPFIKGDPGTSKSDSISQFADKNKLKLIDIRLSQIDPTELNGFPTLNEARDRMSYAPLKMIPLDGDKIPTGYNGFILFFDEFNSGSNSVQAAAYKVILDRFIGNRKLHPACIVICAGNLDSNKAITNKLSTAMQSRLVHITVVMTSKDWLKWAVSHGIDQRIISFIKFKPTLLHKFDANHNDSTFPCGRTWHFASNYIVKKPKLDHTNFIVTAGCVGEGPATEFKTFTNIYSTLPTISQMVADPANFIIKDEPSVQYALTTMISHAFEKHPTELSEALSRFPVEFQAICLREAVARKPANFHIQEIQDWCQINSTDLFE